MLSLWRSITRFFGAIIGRCCFNALLSVYKFRIYSLSRSDQIKMRSWRGINILSSKVTKNREAKIRTDLKGKKNNTQLLCNIWDIIRRPQIRKESEGLVHLAPMWARPVWQDRIHWIRLLWRCRAFSLSISSTAAELFERTGCNSAPWKPLSQLLFP